MKRLLDTRRDTLNGTVGFVRRSIDDRNFYKAFVELRSEEYEIRGQPSTQTDLLSIGFGQRFTELPQVAFPQRGRYLEYELRGASSELYSDTSYARLHITAKTLLPLGSNGRFRLVGDFGFAEVEDFDLYPTSLRFFAGGDSSIRGYSFKSLGPEDEDGNVIGGENLAVVSAEYDHRIAPQWVLAAFVDGGNAYNDKLDDINVGAGFGARWVMDFGSLRIDLAWPVSGRRRGVRRRYASPRIWGGLVKNVKKIVYWSLGSLALILVLVMVTAAGLLGTESGVSWALGKAQRMAPDMLSIERIEGQPVGPPGARWRER